MLNHQKPLHEPNPGKNLVRRVGGMEYFRFPIRTHFVTIGEDYRELVQRYVVPYYRPGDILAISEKVISLCQGQVMLLSSMKISWLARFLCRFAMRNPAGPAMDNVYKMQAAINLRGPGRVLLAAAAAGIGKALGIGGIFYRILGQEVAGIDGFCVVGYKYYADKGILSPHQPDLVCAELKRLFGVDAMIVDANDLGVELLGKAPGMPLKDSELRDLIQDNPAGQKTEQTPFMLIRAAGKQGYHASRTAS